MAFSTIDKSTLYQNTVLYDGDGTDARGITGVGFQPDLTLIKQRDDYDRDWIWTDAVRAATKTLRSNTTAGESTDGSYLQSFNADGFTIGDSVNVNNSSGNNYYAAWNWKANGSGSANTDRRYSFNSFSKYYKWVFYCNLYRYRCGRRILLVMD